MKFSIITCTYNSAEYLQKNIDSVKNQTYQNFEHIFIDGFSSDATIEIIKKYQEEFPEKVKLFQFKPKGISDAMNRGAEESAGEYLIHLHSDDNFYANTVLQEVSDFIKIKDDPDWIYGKINVVEQNNESIGTFPEKKILQLGKNYFSNYLLKFFNFIPHQAVFIKKEIFEKFGFFDEVLSSSMDYDLWLRLRKKTNWLFFDSIISNYKIRPDAQSSGKKNSAKNKNDLEIVQKSHLNFFELYISRAINEFIAKTNKTQR